MKCDHITNSSVLSHIETIIDYEYECLIRKLIKSNRTLLILDGFDENTEIELKPLLDGNFVMIKEQRCRIRSKILITTRGTHVDRVVFLGRIDRNCTDHI